MAQEQLVGTEALTEILRDLKEHTDGNTASVETCESIIDELI